MRGSMSDIEKTSVAPWKRIAKMWNTWFTSPSRISKEEVEKYKAWLIELKEKGCQKALVMGATPELRDILNELNYEVTIIDINQEMITAMTHEMKTKNSKEKIINSNWLDNPLQTDYFDIIIGDAIFPNIPWDERQNLLNEIKRLLKPDGYFVTRAFCIPKNHPRKTVGEVLEFFKDREPTYENSLKFVLELQILSFNSETHIATFSDPKELLEKQMKGGKFEFETENLNKLAKMIYDFWCQKFLDKLYIYNTVDLEEQEYSQLFNIEKRYEAKDNEYSDITPMYLLQLK